jgi:hypothetical protein
MAQNNTTPTSTKKRAKGSPSKSTKFTFGEGTKNDASAIHVQASDGKHHGIGVRHLHVRVAPEGKGWFAQAFEIDYGVQGSTPEEARKRFERGLLVTIHHNLDIFGHIKHLLKVNQEWWDKEENEGQEYDYALVSTHEIDAKAAPLLPFTDIEFETMRAAA